MADFYTYEQIVSQAKKVKSNVEKDYKLGENSQWAYFFACAIMKPKINVEHLVIKSAPSPIGDDVDLQIMKSSYEDMARRLIKYCDNNKTMPNYITYKTKRIKVNDYTYMFARILVYFYEHRQFPNYANVNSASFKKPVIKKYGHSTKSGCDNMGQDTGYYCACHSLQEVIRNLYNIVVPQKTLAGWMGTTSAGTSHNGIRTGASQFNKIYGKNLQMTEKNFSDLGWNGIKKIVDSSNQDCIIHNLYRNKYGHYEVVNNVSSNVNVQNSLGNKCNNGCYCGYIEYRSQNTFKSYINGISQKSILVFRRG